MQNEVTSPALHAAMRQACAVARGFLGATSPNPPVGAAVLDAAGRVLATAAHQRAGEAHAEINLLNECHDLGILHQVHTLCVTLEPCNHHGRTPPCTKAIIAAGIRQVAIGCPDPNPHVAGGGMERLRQAGISVIENVDPNECAWLMHAFLYKAKTGKPWVTVKRALTPDGSMIPQKGQKTFTSPESLRLAHRLRKKADAILTTRATIEADNPLFTVRHVPDHAGKKRWLAIMDRHDTTSPDYLEAAETHGFTPRLFSDFTSAIKELSNQGAQDILIEAGPELSDKVLQSAEWTMRLDIHQGDPDILDVAFHPDLRDMPPRETFGWDLFLPD